MNSIKLIVMTLLAMTACDDLLDNEETFNNFACSVVPYYVADCTDPVVQDRVRGVLRDGIVDAQVECLGVALNSTGKFVSVYYQASKLQDGSCFATSNLTGPNPSGPGFVQSGSSKLTRRSDVLAETCPVTSWHVPQLRSTTTVSGGVVRVESPFCAGGACTMLVSTNCTGLNIEDF